MSAPTSDRPTVLPSARFADALAMVDRHRALFAAVFYLFVSVVGAIYYALLLGEFGLDAFAYWEASDFLLAVFREPTALLFSLVAVMFWIGISHQREFSDWQYAKLPWLGRLLRYERWRDSRFWNSSPSLLVTSAFTVFWFMFVMGGLASGAAQDALDGDGERVEVRYGEAAATRAIVLTATNRYLFLVVPAPSPQAARVMVVPHEAVVSISTCGERRGFLRRALRRAEPCVDPG